MTEEKAFIVEYKREGDDHHYLTFGSKALPDISIDYTGMTQEQRAGTARKLLSAAALYCFASTLGSSLRARGVNIKSLWGRASAETGQDDYKRTKVAKIRIEVDVDLDDADLPVLEKCSTIAERGCLVTYSLEEGIEVEKEIRRVQGG